MYFNNINNLQAKIKKFIYIFLLHFINRYKEIHKKKKSFIFFTGLRRGIFKKICLNQNSFTQILLPK